MNKFANKVKVGITMGDPSGIGPIITLKAINKLKGLFDFVVIGDKGVLNRILNSKLLTPGSKLLTPHCKLIDLKNINHKSFSFGKVKTEYGKASIQYLDKALELIADGEIDCIVTCPISKEAINLAGFHYSGHTEYFAARTNTNNSVMMLLNPEIKISLVTRHIPLKSVPFFITQENFFSTVILTYNSLRNLFFIKNPRIAVCGLNPHASDNGVIGDEENKIIIPALKRLKKAGIKCVDGPLSADVAIAKTRANLYDCAIAMYHDQALIPLKVLGDKLGVNLTLGLPFIRSSPLHGTAFDLAKTGLNRANSDSLIAAIMLAAKCVNNLRKNN